MADDDDDSLSVSSASSATTSSDSDTDVTSVNTSSISLTETLMSVTSRATGMSKIYSIAPDSANSKSSSSSTGSSSDSSYSNNEEEGKVVYDNRVTISSRQVPQHLHEPLSNAMQGLQRHEEREVIGHVSNLRTLIDDMKAMKEEGRKKDAVLIQQTVLAANDAIEIENENENNGEKKEEGESGDATASANSNEKEIESADQQDNAPRSTLLDSISSYLAKDDDSIASTSDSDHSSISSTTDSNASSVMIREATRVTPSSGKERKAKPARQGKYSLEDLLNQHKKERNGL
jgi:hypothetical protein